MEAFCQGTTEMNRHKRPSETRHITASTRYSAGLRWSPIRSHGGGPKGRRERRSSLTLHVERWRVDVSCFWRRVASIVPSKFFS